MAKYQPSQGLTWKYRQSDGILKIVSAIYVDIDPLVDKNVTSTCTGIIHDTAIIILTVNTSGTLVNNPVVILQEIIVADLGQDQSIAVVQGYIRTLKPIKVIALVYKNGEIVGEATGSTSQNSELDYD